MSHAHALIPDFSVPLAAPPLCIERVPFHADPVLAAIDRHSEAWSVFQVAPDGEPSQAAEDECDAARAALLGTACATREGAFCLLRHLRWWLDEEAPNAEGYGDDWRVAQAREADLTLLLGCDGIRRIPVALPLGRLVSVPVESIPPAAMRTVRRTPQVIDVEHARAPAPMRFRRAAAAAGEMVVALAKVIGGCGLVEFGSLL